MLKMAVLMFLADLVGFCVRAVDHSVICTGRPDAPTALTLISMSQSVGMWVKIVCGVKGVWC